MKEINYSKTIPLISEYDTVVIGSGPAGIAAAVASARGGAETLLVERLGAIGGNLTLGEICPILGSVSKGTMADEIKDVLAKGHERVEAVTHNGVRCKGGCGFSSSDGLYRRDKGGRPCHGSDTLGAVGTFRGRGEGGHRRDG